VKDISPEARSLLTILIREIQDIIKETPDSDINVEARIDKLITTWITANNLHPEQVMKTEAGLYSYRVS
jgi:hypothetical protein